MEPALSVEQVFFPLDEEWGLLPGSFTPKQQEKVTHLARWMPFDKAASLLERLVGVQVSEATVRRHTSRAGQMVQEEEDERSRSETKGERESEHVPAPMAISADGACVPLVGGIWAEARTLAMATVVQRENTTHRTDRSYFSRMTEATTFPRLCPGERERRHLCEAKAVAGVMDGAEWLQGMLDVHRPDAVRMLDFPPAAQRVSAIIEAAQQAGRPLPLDARERSLHLLKHRGPKPLLRWLRSVTRTLDPVNKAHEDLAYVHKREALMQYPRSRVDGWPIGSGMGERANALVVQARLKGSGMHWAPSPVNPLLSLRAAMCSDRWENAWQIASSRTQQQLYQRRLARSHQRQQQILACFFLNWMRFLRPQSCDPAPTRVPVSPSLATMVNGRPTASHPWKRSLANLSAKR